MRGAAQRGSDGVVCFPLVSTHMQINQQNYCEEYLLKSNRPEWFALAEKRGVTGTFPFSGKKKQKSPSKYAKICMLDKGKQTGETASSSKDWF